MMKEYDIDLEANETMRKLADLPPITANSKEGKEIRELMDGLGLDDEYMMLAVYAYTLGRG